MQLCRQIDGTVHTSEQAKRNILLLAIANYGYWQYYEFPTCLFPSVWSGVNRFVWSGLARALHSPLSWSLWRTRPIVSARRAGEIVWPGGRHS